MRKTTINFEIGSPHGNYVIDEEEEEVETGSPHSSNPSVWTSRKGKESQSNERSKKRKVQNFLPPRTSPRSQPSIWSALATNSKYYQAMWDAVTTIGAGYKGPTFYELRGALLKDLVKEV